MGVSNFTHMAGNLRPSHCFLLLRDLDVAPGADRQMALTRH